MTEKNALLGKKNFQTKEDLKTPTQKMPKAFFVSDPVNSISPNKKSCQ